METFFKKNSLLFIAALSLSIAHFNSTQSSFHASLSGTTDSISNFFATLPYKKIALATAGLVGGYYLGKWAYNYFFTLTDLQEIERAYKLCNEAEQKVEQSKSAHKFWRICILPAVVGCHYESMTFEHQIGQSNSKYPYYYYAKNRSSDHDALVDTTRELQSTKTRLMQRKLNLAINKDKEKNEHEIAILTSEYTKAIALIEVTLPLVSKEVTTLNDIISWITSTQRYQTEMQQIRIEQLERENARLQAEAAFHSYNAFHNNRPTETHIYVNQQPTCCAASTVCASAREECSSQPSSCCTTQTISECCVQPTECQSSCQAQCCPTESQTCCKAKKCEPSYPAACSSSDSRVQAFERCRDEIGFTG